MTPEERYEKAGKDIAHYLRLLAGAGLTEADKRRARLRLIGAQARRAWALVDIEQEVDADEMVAA